MVVVLDTNIIIQAPRLDGDLHKVLYDYLDKTDSHLIMPDIVYEEVSVVYRRRLFEEQARYLKARKQLENILDLKRA